MHEAQGLQAVQAFSNGNVQVGSGDGHFRMDRTGVAVNLVRFRMWDANQ